MVARDVIYKMLALKQFKAMSKVYKVVDPSEPGTSDVQCSPINGLLVSKETVVLRRW